MAEGGYTDEHKSAGERGSEGGDLRRDARCEGSDSHDLVHARRPDLRIMEERGDAVYVVIPSPVFHYLSVGGSGDRCAVQP